MEKIFKKVVAYCRVSTDAQAGEDRFGIDNQKEIILSYCEKHDMEVVEWFIDEGESGAKESRPALDDLLFGDMSNPPIEAVVVAKSDRVARDIKLYFYYMMLLEKRKISLISATEEVVNDDTGLGNVYKAMMMFVAEQERANITKRTSGGRRVKAARGGYSGGRPPYGYKAVSGRLLIEPAEAEIVKLVYGLRESEATYQEILFELKERGYKTRTGTEFGISGVQSILNNEKLYKGLYKYGKTGEWIQGEHEAIL